MENIANDAIVALARAEALTLAGMVLVAVGIGVIFLARTMYTRQRGESAVELNASTVNQKIADAFIAQIEAGRKGDEKRLEVTTLLKDNVAAMNAQMTLTEEARARGEARTLSAISDAQTFIDKQTAQRTEDGKRVIVEEVRLAIGEVTAVRQALAAQDARAGERHTQLVGRLDDSLSKLALIIGLLPPTPPADALPGGAAAASAATVILPMVMPAAPDALAAQVTAQPAQPMPQPEGAVRLAS